MSITVRHTVKKGESLSGIIKDELSQQSVRISAGASGRLAVEAAEAMKIPVYDTQHWADMARTTFESVCRQIGKTAARVGGTCGNFKFVRIQAGQVVNFTYDNGKISGFSITPMEPSTAGGVEREPARPSGSGSAPATQRQAATPARAAAPPPAQETVSRKIGKGVAKVYERLVDIRESARELAPDVQQRIGGLLDDANAYCSFATTAAEKADKIPAEKNGHTLSADLSLDLAVDTADKACQILNDALQARLTPRPGQDKAYTAAPPSTTPLAKIAASARAFDEASAGWPPVTVSPHTLTASGERPAELSAVATADGGPSLDGGVSGGTPADPEPSTPPAVAVTGGRPATTPLYTTDDVQRITDEALRQQADTYGLIEDMRFSGTGQKIILYLLRRIDTAIDLAKERVAKADEITNPEEKTGFIMEAYDYALEAKKLASEAYATAATTVQGAKRASEPAEEDQPTTPPPTVADARGAASARPAAITPPRQAKSVRLPATMEASLQRAEAERKRLMAEMTAINTLNLDPVANPYARFNTAEDFSRRIDMSIKLVRQSQTSAGDRQSHLKNIEELVGELRTCHADMQKEVHERRLAEVDSWSASMADYVRQNTSIPNAQRQSLLSEIEAARNSAKTAYATLYAFNQKPGRSTMAEIQSAYRPAQDASKALLALSDKCFNPPSSGGDLVTGVVDKAQKYLGSLLPRIKTELQRLESQMRQAVQDLQTSIRRG